MRENVYLHGGSCRTHGKNKSTMQLLVPWNCLQAWKASFGATRKLRPVNYGTSIANYQHSRRAMYTLL